MSKFQYSYYRCIVDINECSAAPCDHGTCSTPSINMYECNCAGTGYSGTNCETDILECASNPCENSGICNELTANEYTCNCDNTGYDGDVCQNGKFDKHNVEEGLHMYVQ